MNLLLTFISLGAAIFLVYFYHRWIYRLGYRHGFDAGRTMGEMDAWKSFNKLRNSIRSSRALASYRMRRVPNTPSRPWLPPPDAPRPGDPFEPS